MAEKPADSQFTISGATPILLAEGEDGPTRLAAGLLAGDIKTITGKQPKVAAGQPPEGKGCIFIASADNPRAVETLQRLGVRIDAIAGKWEAYLFAVAGEVLVICGADGQATLRGVYGFTRLALGVDPLVRWTGIKPGRRKEIRLAGVDRVVDAPTFKFRGWFLNSGTLIHWNLGRGPEVDMAKYAGRVDEGISGAYGRDMAAMILESCLRADINTIIPASCLSLDDPDEKRLADLCSQYGIYVNHHHLEPVGANLRDWEIFWQRRDEAVPEMSFWKNPDKFETWWKHFIDLWAQYPRVVWCIGHRGPGDRPFWLKDSFCPDTIDAHGKVVSDAMAMQLRLIRQAAPDRPAHYCATLWQDGAEMHAAGTLTFPPGTMVLMADHGSKQMMREDFYEAPRHADLQYGVYFHVCYGPGGPQRAEGCSVDKMWYTMRQPIERGDRAMALLNVGCIRSYLPTLQAWSDITTAGHAGFEPEDFLIDWCRPRYGDEHAEEIVECYNAFFAAYLEPYRELYDGHRGLWDGVLNNECLRIFQLIYSGDIEGSYPKINRPFASARLFLAFHRNKTAVMQGSWEALCRKAHALSAGLKGAAKDLFEGNVVIQAEIMRALSCCAYHVSRSGLAVLAGDKAQAVAQLRRARPRMLATWEYTVARGNRGVYKKWYKPRRVGGMELQSLDDMIDHLSGTPPKTEKDRQRVESRFALGAKG